jgi:hypothetical protein
MGFVHVFVMFSPFIISPRSRPQCHTKPSSTVLLVITYVLHLFTPRSSACYHDHPNPLSQAAGQTWLPTPCNIHTTTCHHLRTQLDTVTITRKLLGMGKPTLFTTLQGDECASYIQNCLQQGNPKHGFVLSLNKLSSEGEDLILFPQYFLSE